MNRLHLVPRKRGRRRPTLLACARSVATANVFRRLAIENPGGLDMLVSLANKILIATRKGGA